MKKTALQPDLHKREIMVEIQEDNNKNPLTEAQKNNTKSPKKPVFKSIRTYAGDVANLVNKGMSLTDIALSEQKRKLSKRIPTPVVEKKDSGHKIIVSIAIILILVGIAIVVGSFVIREDVDPQIAELNVSPLIFANSQKEVSVVGLDRVNMMKKINQNRAASNATLGSIVNLYVTNEEAGVKRLITTREFLEKIETGVAKAFVRSLGDRFMLGIHSFDGNQAFLLFEIDSFDNAFAEALNWERFMLDDLWVMFYNQKPQEKTFSEIEGSIFNEGFKDVITKNKDTRVLKNENNETILVYSFPDRKHMVITTDKNTLIEVLNRLTTGRFKN